MGDLGLLLEDGAHQVRQARVDVDDLLELVDDERGAPLSGAAELSRKLEQPFQGRVDVRRSLADPER